MSKKSSEKSALRRAISRQVYRSHERLLEEALEQTPEVTDLLKLREMYPQYDEEKLLRLQRLNEKSPEWMCSTLKDHTDKVLTLEKCYAYFNQYKMRQRILKLIKRNII